MISLRKILTEEDADEQHANLMRLLSIKIMSEILINHLISKSSRKSKMKCDTGWYSVDE